MKSSTAWFLQGIVLIVGIGVLGLMLWEPHLEGRNARATVFEIYFKDPFLAYAYLGSLPFFMALRRAFGLLGRARRTGTFSQATLDDLRAIKRCAIAVIGFAMGGMAFIAGFGDGDDRPAGLFMGLLVVLAATLIATTAALWARRLRHALTRVA